MVFDAPGKDENTIKQAKIIVMTCTHAALRRNKLVKLGFKYDNMVMEEAAQILETSTPPNSKSSTVIMARPKNTQILRSSKALTSRIQTQSSVQPVRAQSVATRPQARSTLFSSNQNGSVPLTSDQRASTSSPFNLNASTLSSINQNGSVPSSPNQNQVKSKPVDNIQTVFDAGDCDIVPTELTIAEIETINQTKKVICILDVSGALTHASSPRIPIVKVIEARIPNGCLVANQGQELGGWTRSTNVDYPGIPSRYFTIGDLAKYGGDSATWTIQSVFENPNYPDWVFTKYLGWDALTAWEETKNDVFKKSPHVEKWIAMKKCFLAAIMTLEPKNLVETGVKRERFLGDGLLTNKEHVFWIYQEMSYLHSFVNRANGLPSIWYMNVKNLNEPPKFHYSVVNVIEKRLLDEYQKQEEGLQQVKKLKRSTGTRTACENPETCVRDSIFEYYNRKDRDDEELPDADKIEESTRKNMQPDAFGRLDFKGFDADDQRMVVECSDACGCSINCPRRQLQRGQKFGVVVYYEDDCRRFGLRALEPIEKGQFIIEYTGQILEVEPEEIGVIEDRDTSYDAEFAIMDRRKVVTAINIGNAARFMAHACTPSATFIETHSRQLVSDPLIPRISVYALKDINVGEEITIKYFRQDQMLKKKEGTKCRCRAKCKNWLPIYPYESDDDME
ncbi:hypothetical protein B9Z55_026564 [Caenorhabditis nigoni]|uniref:SET domain-containing protein n=1 Tax=Caenorhabditis nigoni TaxID=1611254 RepID=A0A2G5T3P2_9PELO|nr:hypothetical protein B9Z55_026564 [Caenorhabditis nigoni]